MSESGRSCILISDSNCIHPGGSPSANSLERIVSVELPLVVPSAYVVPLKERVSFFRRLALPPSSDPLVWGCQQVPLLNDDLEELLSLGGPSSLPGLPSLLSPLPVLLSCHTLVNLILQDGYLRVKGPYERLIPLRLIEFPLIDLLQVCFLVSMNARSHQRLEPFEFLLFCFLETAVAAFFDKFVNSVIDFVIWPRSTGPWGPGTLG